MDSFIHLMTRSPIIFNMYSILTYANANTENEFKRECYTFFFFLTSKLKYFFSIHHHNLKW